MKIFSTLFFLITVSVTAQPILRNPATTNQWPIVNGTNITGPIDGSSITNVGNNTQLYAIAFQNSIPSDWTNAGAFTANATGIHPPAGAGSGITSFAWKNYTLLNNVASRWYFTFEDTNSIFAAYSKTPRASTEGIIVMVNGTNGTLSVAAPWDGSATIPAVVTNVPLPVSLQTNRVYMLELFSADHGGQVFRFSDTITATNASIGNWQNPIQAASWLSGTNGVMHITGNYTIKKFELWDMLPGKTKLVIYGDSLTVPATSTYWSSQLSGLLPGKVHTAALGSMGVANILEDVAWHATKLRAAVAIINIGANDTDTSPTWTNIFNTIVSILGTNGTRVIPATIIPHAAFMETNQNRYIRSTFGQYIEQAGSVAINRNPEGLMDPALDSGDGVHVLPQGQTNMALAVRFGAAELFDETRDPADWACREFGSGNFSGSVSGTNNLDIWGTTFLRGFLNVSNTVTVQGGTVQIINSNNAAANLYLSGNAPTAGNQYWRITAGASGQSHRLSILNDSDEFLSILSGTSGSTLKGYVGLSRSTPKSRLDVVGDIIASTYITATNGYYIPTNAISAWPTAPRVAGEAYVGNSNGVLYVLTSTPGAATWAATNKWFP